MARKEILIMSMNKYLQELKEKLDENNDDLMVAYEMVEFTFNALINELRTK